MSTVQGTASPRAPRGKQQLQPGATAQPGQNHNGKQRRPRRAHNGGNQHNIGGVSPSRPPLVGTDSGAGEFSNEEAQSSTGPRNLKKHTKSQPSVDRVFSPPGAQASLTDNENVPHHPNATPAKIQGAYAGPTFHASPAPSALPIPKFLSRSVPAKTRTSPPTPPPEDSSDSADSPTPAFASPSRAPISIPSRNEDSPVDFLFKADRAERAKNIGGSPASSGFFSPSNLSRPPHHKHDSYNSLNAPFPIELDGQAGPTHVSPRTVVFSTNSRSVTDPNQVPQVKDVAGSPNNNDVMQDLLSRLSQSQMAHNAGTPPRPDVFAPSDPHSRHETPSPSLEGRSAVRSASGPSTPSAAPGPEGPDFFYGNRNLSPLFKKAVQPDQSKRNSGLRTEITADSPLISQGMFQDFPSISSPAAKDHNNFSPQPAGNGGNIPAGPRRGSAPYVQPYHEHPNNQRRTPAKHHSHHPRPDSYPGKGQFKGPNTKPGKPKPGSPAPAVKKPMTSMMSFVPASVAAKQHSSSTPPAASTPPLAKATPTKTTPPPDTSALEHDLKRLLNLNMSGST